MPTRATLIIPQHSTFHRNSPVMRIYPIAHIALKCRMRPINRTLTMPVFKLVEMNVIDMAGKIIFITNLVFPETLLPNSRFAMFEF